MSTGEVQKPSEGTSPKTVAIEDWNLEYYRVDARMARKMRFEADEALKRKPRPLPRKAGIYPPLSTWEQQIADVKKLSADKRAAGYDAIMKTLQTSTRQLMVDKRLDGEAQKREQAVLTAALQKLKAESAADAQPQKPVVSPDERKKAILARLDAIKDDLKRAEKAPQDTPELQRDAAALVSTKQSLMASLQGLDYDTAEKDIAKLENLCARLAAAEAKKRTVEVEKIFADLATNSTPQTKKTGKAVTDAIADANFNNIDSDINGAFNQENIDKIEAESGAADSKLATVVDAMKKVMTEQNSLSKGTGTAAALSKAITTLQTEAQKYLKDHKSALTKEGKSRITAAESMLASAQTVLAVITKANDQALAAALVLKGANGDSLSYPMIAALEKAEKSPHLLVTTKSKCQFEIIEAKKRLAVVDDARLLKIAKPLDSMNANDLTGFMILKVEDAFSAAEKERTVDGAVKSQVLATIKTARAKLAVQLQKQLADPGLSDKEKIAIQLARCGAKPPKGKGESDSFFVYGADGKPAYIFKPKEGENVKSGVEGGGAARELLTSKFNDVMKQATGLDFGVAPTKVAHFESEQFKSGTRSQATKRVGALQAAIPNEGSILDMANEDPSKLALIPDEDVQKIALLDFVTLQADRNCGNLLIQDVAGQKRLVPIDGGFSFPTTEDFKAFSVGMAANGQVGPGRGLKGAENAASQLPQSNKPFTPAMLKVIADMKPDQIVAQMKQAAIDVENDAPELQGTVDPKCFDNVGRSINFLKKAAKVLTPAQLTLVYALDFSAVLEADDADLDGLMDEIIATALKKPAFDAAMQSRQQTYDTLGGDDALKKAGWPINTDAALKLDLKRKIEILQNPGANPPPPTQPAPVQPPDPTDDAAYKQLGGDSAVKAMLKAGETETALSDNLGKRLGVLRSYKSYKDAGGDNLLAELLQSGDTTVQKTSSLNDRTNALEKYAAFKAAGGDALLGRLSAAKDPRVKAWKKNDTSQKLRALLDYKSLAADGAEYERLGGAAKIAELQKTFYFKAPAIPVQLDFLRKNADLEARGGADRFRAIIRKWKRDSTTLFEDLDASGKKIRIVFVKYERQKGGVEALNTVEEWLDIVTRCA